MNVGGRLGVSLKKPGGFCGRKSNSETKEEFGVTQSCLVGLSERLDRLLRQRETYVLHAPRLTKCRGYDGLLCLDTAEKERRSSTASESQRVRLC